MACNMTPAYLQAQTDRMKKLPSGNVPDLNERDIELAAARAEIETLKDALYRSMDTTGKQAAVIAQARRL